MISQTLPNFMYTHMMGNPNCRPTIELRVGSVVQFALASSRDFEGGGVDNFYHQIQNIDVRPLCLPLLGSRACSLTPDGPAVGGRASAVIQFRNHA